MVKVPYFAKHSDTKQSLAWGSTTGTSYQTLGLPISRNTSMPDSCLIVLSNTPEQGNLLFASEFLQNVVFINLQMNDEEKVHRFSALAKLYAEIKVGAKDEFEFGQSLNIREFYSLR